MQIGQVMLALPNAVAVAGMRAAVPLIVVYACLSIYTIHLLTSCYAQLKLRKVCGCFCSAGLACGRARSCRLIPSCLCYPETHLGTTIVLSSSDLNQAGLPVGQGWKVGWRP